MSFGGMFDGAGSGVFSYDAGGGMHNPARLLPSPPIPTRPGGGGGAGFSSSTGLSLGLVSTLRIKRVCLLINWS
jgi:homeobox-leucine zipper protein